MEKNLYSNLGQSKANLVKLDFDKIRLKELSSANLAQASAQDLKKCLINDLKSILEMDSLQGVVREVIELEKNIESTRTQVEDADSLPDLSEFYLNLSPLLLRSLANFPNSDHGIEEVLHSWLESLRISLEEEIFSLQEQL